jgi:hypothetical protein
MRMTMVIETDWSLATWEGNRRQQHLEFLRLPFRRKLEIIEELGEITMFFAERRRARGLPVDPRITDPPS